MPNAPTKSCPCEACRREGQYNPWCVVHEADHEGERCDCGLRDGERRTPELAPATVHCSVDPKERPS